MIKKHDFNFLGLLFFSLPLSIILGPSISLINIFLFILIYFSNILKRSFQNIILKDKTIRFIIFTKHIFGF